MPAFDTTLGAAFIGGILTAILYGVTCVQAFIYYRTEGIRVPIIDRLVGVLFFLDTIHLASVIHPLYFYMVTNYTNPVVLANMEWTIPAGVILTATIDTLVRFFFLHRIWTMSGHNRWIVFPLIVCVFMVELAGLGFAIKAIILPGFREIGTFSYLLYGAFAFSVLDDFLIAGSLCYYLYRSLNGIRRTDSILTTLMAYTINTGVLTTIFETACFVTYAAMPGNFIFMAIYFPISKLFINSMLASLNARGSLRAGLMQQSDRISIPLSKTFKSQPSSGITYTSTEVHSDIKFVNGADTYISGASTYMSGVSQAI